MFRHIFFKSAQSTIHSLAHKTPATRSDYIIAGAGGCVIATVAKTTLRDRRRQHDAEIAAHQRNVQDRQNWEEWEASWNKACAEREKREAELDAQENLHSISSYLK